MRHILILFAVIAVVAIAGCINQAVTITASDVKVTASFIQSQIKPTETATLFIDVENTGTQDIKNLTIDVFETGALYIIAPKENACIASIEELRPAQIQSAECTFVVAHPESLIQDTLSTDVRFRTTFQKSISGTAIVNALTLEEYRRLERTGALESKSQSITFGDSQVTATLQFSKQPPFIAGDTVIAVLSVSNAGLGNVYTLDDKRFILDQTGNEMKCNFGTTLYSMNGVFVPITCILNVPQDIQTSATYPFTFTIGYDYEFRNSIPLSIKRS